MRQQSQTSFAPVRVDLLVVLGSIVNALGGHKRVGCRLRPNLSAEKARVWCAHCLDPRRRENFRPSDIEDIFKMAHAAGYHDGKHAFDRLVGYRPSDAMTPDEARDHLMRQIHDEQRKLADGQALLAGLMLQLGAIGGGKEGD